jgi:hypothetical protein
MLIFFLVIFVDLYISFDLCDFENMDKYIEKWSPIIDFKIVNSAKNN